MIAGICKIEYVEIKDVTDFPFQDFLQAPPVSIQAWKLPYKWTAIRTISKIPDIKFVSKGTFYEIQFSFSADLSQDKLPAMNDRRVILRLTTRAGETFLLGLRNQPALMLVSTSLPEAGSAFSSFQVEIQHKQTFYPARIT